MSELIICRGLQGSGKSTHAKEWVSENPGQRSRVNRDEIRLNYFNTVYDPAVEELVSQVELSIMADLLSAGRDVISDNTNLAEDRVKGYLELARKHEAKVSFLDFDVDIDEVIRRDAARPVPIGEAIIRGYQAKYMVDGKFPPAPTLN